MVLSQRQCLFLSYAWFLCWAWWHMLLIPIVRSERQMDFCESKAQFSLHLRGQTERPCFRKQNERVEGRAREDFLCLVDVAQGHHVGKQRDTPEGSPVSCVNTHCMVRVQLYEFSLLLRTLEVFFSRKKNSFLTD